MGRRTYEDHQYAFPDRLNIVVTRNRQYPLVEGVSRSTSLATAVALADGYSSTTFVIGGTRLLEEAFPLCDQVFETIVDTDISGDAQLGRFDFTGWHTRVTGRHAIDERHAYAFTAYLHTRV